MKNWSNNTKLVKTLNILFWIFVIPFIMIVIFAPTLFGMLIDIPVGIWDSIFK